MWASFNSRNDPFNQGWKRHPINHPNKLADHPQQLAECLCLRRFRPVPTKGHHRIHRPTPVNTSQLEAKRSGNIWKIPSLVALDEPHSQSWNTSAHWGIGRTRCTEAFQKPLVKRDSKAPTFKTKEPERKIRIYKENPKMIEVYHRLT